MTRRLQDDRRGPEAARALVVFLHGYGADGADLLGLADPLAEHLPGVAFRAPDAPEPCGGNPFGRQWFPIPWLDGSSETEARAGIDRAKADLHTYLDEVLAEEGLDAGALALVGFSQGTMMALAVAPERDPALAGVVGFSGRLLDTSALAGARSRPPVLLLHGDQDQMVPFTSMAEAGQALDAAGFTVYGHVMRGTGHGIAPDGLSAAVTALRDWLGVA